MIKSITAYVNENRELITNESEGFVGENNAEVLEIALGPFAQEGFDYYVINYSTGVIGGESSSDAIKSEEDSPAYVKDGVIYFPLEFEHTSTGSFKFQLDACKNTDGKDIVVKTSIAKIKFKSSLRGGNPVGSNSLILGKINKLEEIIENLKNTLKEDMSESENRFLADIAELESKHGNDLTLVDERFSQITSEHNVDVERLENEIEESRNIPVAGLNRLGGVKFAGNSAFKTDSEDNLVLDFANIDPYALTVIVATILAEHGSISSSIIFESPEDAGSAIGSLNEQIMMVENSFVVYSFINGGKYTYYDMDFNELEVEARSKSLHVMKNANGIISVEEYTYKNLKKLLIEGVSFE